MDSHIAPVEQENAYRLINHGPTVLVSASHDGVENVISNQMLRLDQPTADLRVGLNGAS